MGDVGGKREADVPEDELYAQLHARMEGREVKAEERGKQGQGA